MIIKILGSECKKCGKLEENTNQALQRLKLTASIEKVTDFIKISKYGVMQTPALVVNEQVVASGKLLTVSEIEAILNNM